MHDDGPPRHGERIRAAAAARLAVVGLLVQVVYLGGIFGATAAGVDAGTSALIAALQPLVVAGLAGPVLGERTTARQRLGLLLGAAALRGALRPPATPGFAAAIAWLVVLASFGGYGTYLFVVRRSGATRASALLYLTPPTSSLAAWALFGQWPGPTAGPGLVVCAAGVAFALRPARGAITRSPRPASPTSPTVRRRPVDRRA